VFAISAQAQVNRQSTNQPSPSRATGTRPAILRNAATQPAIVQAAVSQPAGGQPAIAVDQAEHDFGQLSAGGVKLEHKFKPGRVGQSEAATCLYSWGRYVDGGQCAGAGKMNEGRSCPTRLTIFFL
jgi:hypothetical protein